MEQTKNFYCYSLQLKNFLKLQGISYVTSGCHKKSGNTFWVFPNSSALDQALLDWNTYKNMFWKEKNKC